MKMQRKFDLKQQEAHENKLRLENKIQKLKQMLHKLNEEN